mmetsp:Transcript_35413/g.67774  ORF Transcript_35413/g.67774 Transcript_35413/m.67774 type:complete len:426 (-) Transcript_35413:221-1498(-)|eukprot:CAMPEP_0114244674 /NCGR_PEP_ID=MMETSP0058-20121206/11471_1 /TAXON_ID=36894 /ORGANISM="Pyramimonas parkeae, CCMP726" /LENGTH=425 /DNA_ID=CAMNT_0001357641 /DNA_START=58 /DNA_END=1335 /DNA_ORIENTATION=-
MELSRLAALLIALLVASQLAGDVSALYSDKDDVVMLSPDNWEDQIGQSGEFWIVEFFAPWCGHCKQLAPEWKKAAKELRGIAKVAAVDCDEHKDLGSKYGVTGFPTIKVFKEGGAGEVSDYSEARSADAIVSFVKNALGGEGPSTKLVAPIKYLEAYAFFYMLEPAAKVKVVLFTQGESKVPSWYSSLAVKFKKGKEKTAAFSQVMAENSEQATLASRLGVEYDTLLVARVTGEGEAYYTTLKGVSSKNKGSENLKKAQALIDQLVDETLPEKKQAPLPALPPPDKPRKQADTSFFQLTEDTLLTHCMGSSKKSICLVVAVQAAGDEFMERESLVELSKKYRNDPVSFTWMDGPSQAEFLSTFGVTWEGKARVIAIKTGKKNRYAIHEGGADSADVFVDRILGGDMQFRPLKVMPELTPAYLQDV